MTNNPKPYHRQYDPLLYRALAGMTATEVKPIFEALDLIEDRLSAAGVHGVVRIERLASQSAQNIDSTP